MSDDLLKRLFFAEVAACNCGTKTSDVKYHKPACKYRVLREAREEITALRSQVATLREALAQLLSSDLVQGNYSETPDWRCEETFRATAWARAALVAIAAEEKATHTPEEIAKNPNEFKRKPEKPCGEGIAAVAATEPKGEGGE